MAADRSGLCHIFVNMEYISTKPPSHDDGLVAILAILTVLLAYTYFCFSIHTDASEFQLGAFIIQEDKPITLYGIKLTDPQKMYTVIEEELLRILETLK